VFTARYALSPYIKQIRFAFKGLNQRFNVDNGYEGRGKGTKEKKETDKAGEKLTIQKKSFPFNGVFQLLC
jgi:hypothetical protein